MLPLIIEETVVVRVIMVINLRFVYSCKMRFFNCDNVVERDRENLEGKRERQRERSGSFLYHNLLKPMIGVSYWFSDGLDRLKPRVRLSLEFLTTLIRKKKTD